MRRHRVYADIPLSPGQTITLPTAPSRHLTQVMRLREGEPLVVFNGDGHDYAAIMQQPRKDAAVVLIHARGEIEPAPPLAIHLGVGISKGDRMDLVIQKSVELGVGAITPLFTARCVVRLSDERLQKRLAHWQGVLIGACEQSGRRRLPDLHAASQLEDWLSGAAPGLLLDHRASRGLLDLTPPAGRLSLLVGPEGGLSADERAQAGEMGFQAVRLGPRVLRTETAPLAALAAIQVLWGDMR